MPSYNSDYENAIQYASKKYVPKLVHYSSFSHPDHAQTMDVSGMSEDEVSALHHSMSKKGFVSNELYRDPRHLIVSHPNDPYNKESKIAPQTIHYTPKPGSTLNPVTFQYDNHGVNEIHSHHSDMLKQGYKSGGVVHKHKPPASSEVGMSAKGIFTRIGKGIVARSPLLSAIAGEHQPNWAVGGED